jgi:hypothetical protein
MGGISIGLTIHSMLIDISNPKKNYYTAGNIMECVYFYAATLCMECT